MTLKSNYKSPTDPNLFVDIPPAIKRHVTGLMNAVDEAAFKGSHSPETWADYEESVEIARYNLEATIRTYLEGRNK